jgi:hypothetical protein
MVISTLNSASTGGIFANNIVNAYNSISASYTGSYSGGSLTASTPNIIIKSVSTPIPTSTPTMLESKELSYTGIIAGLVVIVVLLFLALVFYFKRRRLLVIEGLPYDIKYENDDILVTLRDIIPGVIEIRKLGSSSKLLIIFDSNSNAQMSTSINSAGGIILYNHQINLKWSYHVLSLWLLFNKTRKHENKLKLTEIKAIQKYSTIISEDNGISLDDHISINLYDDHTQNQNKVADDSEDTSNNNQDINNANTSKDISNQVISNDNNKDISNQVISNDNSKDISNDGNKVISSTDQISSISDIDSCSNDNNKDISNNNKDITNKDTNDNNNESETLEEKMTRLLRENDKLKQEISRYKNKKVYV